MAIWRVPIAAYTAEAQILHHRTVADGDVDQVPDWIGRITSDQNLQRAQAAALAKTSAGHADSASTDDGYSVDHLRKWVAVRAAPQPELGRTLVTVRYTGDHEETVVWFVDRLAAQFVADAEGAADRAIEQFRAEQTMVIQRQQEAQSKMDQAKGVMDQFVQERLVELESAQESDLRDARLGRGDRPAPQGGSAPVVATSSDAEPTKTPGTQPAWVAPGSTENEPNPHWVVLRQQLIAMEAHRNRLLVHRTPEHPLVLEAEASIRRLKRLMETIPEFQPKAAAGKALSSPAAEPRAEETNPLRKKSRDELLAEIKSSTEYQERHQEYLAADETYQAAASRVQYLAGRPPPRRSERAEIVQPSRMVERHGGRPTAGRMLTLAVVSASVGLAFALVKVTADVFPVLISTADVEVALDLPAFGEITTSDGPRVSKTLRAIPSIVRAATAAGETALCAVCVLLISLAIMDQVFAVQIRRDPFSAYSYAIHRVTSWST